MDLNDIWQENKRWILGVGLGVVVFWVADAVITSLYDSTPTKGKLQNHVRALNRETWYGSQARQAAEAERAELEAAKREVTEALVFTQTEEFQLEGKGAPDVVFDEVSRRVRARLQEQADILNVDMQDRALQWHVPVGAADTRAALVGLALLDEAGKRLMAAHSQTLAGRPDALGLVAVEKLQVEGGRANLTGAAAPSRRGEDALVDEQRVAFQFRADGETVERFLESCRSIKPPLCLGDFVLEVGKNSGEPLKVSGRLLALQLRQP